MHINKIRVVDKFHALFDLQPNNSITNDSRKEIFEHRNITDSKFKSEKYGEWVTQFT